LELLIGRISSLPRSFAPAQYFHVQLGCNPHLRLELHSNKKLQEEFEILEKNASILLFLAS
jgi:hypothetical protein